VKIKLRTRTVVLTAISLTGALVLAFGIRAQQPAACQTRTNRACEPG